MIVLLLTTVTFVAAAPPKLTVAPATKLVPVMVTELPPVVGPLLGLTPVTVGASTKDGAKDAITTPELIVPSEIVVILTGPGAETGSTLTCHREWRYRSVAPVSPLPMTG